jgi:hypothetical protein
MHVLVLTGCDSRRERLDARALAGSCSISGCVAVVALRAVARSACLSVTPTRSASGARLLLIRRKRPLEKVNALAQSEPLRRGTAALLPAPAA